MKTPTNIGITVLAVYLIVIGAIALLNITFRYSSELTGALAVAAGVLLLLKK